MMGRRAKMPRSSEGARGMPSNPAPTEGGGGISASWGADGLDITDTRPRPLWALITGNASGTNRYAWVAVNDGDAPDFAADLAEGFAAEGDSTVEGLPAYEINGREDVPADSTVRVKLWPSGDLSYYTFAYGGEAGGDPATTCEGTAWLTALRPSDCLRLTFTYTPPPEIDLSVTDCAECPDGASLSYTFTLSGGTGDMAALNGVWTATHDEGCDWAIAKTGGNPANWSGFLSFGLAGAGTATLQFDLAAGGGSDGNVTFTVTGLTSCRGPFATTFDEAAGPTGDPPTAPTVAAVEVQPPEETQTLDLTWDSETGLWTSEPEVLTICGEEYAVTIDQDAEELTLTGEQVGGAEPFSLTRRPSCGGCEYARFDFSRLRLCPCDNELAESPCDRLLSIRIERVDCGGTAVTCGAETGTYPSRPFARFSGQLAWLGCVDLGNQSSRPMLDPDGVEISGVTLTSVALYPLTAPGTFCTNVVTLNLSVTGVGFTSWQTLDQAFTLDPYLYEEDFLTPPAVLTAAGYTAGDSSVAVTADACAAVVSGYTTAGWYLTSAGKLNLTDDSAELCSPLTIICGPYASEALLDAAIADGSCFPVDCTPIAGWGGAGWYCVEDGVGGCEAFELDAGHECDTSIVICSGPYVDEATAIAACGADEPPTARYDCVDGACVEAGGGEHATLARCEAKCPGADCCTEESGAATVEATVTVSEVEVFTLTKSGTSANIWNGVGVLSDTGRVILSVLCGTAGGGAPTDGWRYTLTWIHPTDGSSTLSDNFTVGASLTASNTFVGGPYDGEAFSIDVELPCEPGPPDPPSECCTGDYAAEIDYALSGPGGPGCGSISYTGTLTGNPTDGWTGATEAAGMLTATCTGDVWTAVFTLPSSQGTATATLTPSGGDLTGSGPIVGSCSGTITITVTNPCP